MRALWVVLGLFGFFLGCSAASTEERGNGGGPGSGGTGTGGIGVGSTGGIGLGGTGNGNTGGFSGGECAGVTQQANNTVLPADVIWAIDTSGSMTEETAAVQANMNKFSQLIANAGIDVRNILIAEEYSPPVFPGFPSEGICIAPPLGSGACPGDSNPPNYFHLFESVGSTDALQKYLSLFPTYKSQLRPNSLKIFTVVTDDNSAISSQAFIDGVVQLDPAILKPNQWRMYGIFCFFDCPSAAEVGTVYKELVQLSGGISSDLCLQNFDPVFNQLAQGIIGSAKLDCGWVIPDPPPGETFNKSKVNVIYTPGGGAGTPIGKVASAAACGPNGGWYYDDESNPSSVHVCPNTCQVIQADPNGKIDVQFGCDTVFVPE